MTRRSLFAMVLLPFLALLLIALIAAACESFRFLKAFHVDELAKELETQSRIVQRLLPPRLGPNSAPTVDALCKDLVGISGKRITVILPDGKVIGDSDEDISKMDNHADRPEIREALAGKTGTATRYSYTLRNDWFYVAVPVVDSGRLEGVVRTSLSLASVNAALRATYMRIAAAVAMVGFLSALVALAVTRRIVRPLNEMRAAMGRLAQGELATRIPAPDAVELAELARAINHMAQELQAKMQTVNRQRDELSAVLASMEEGVIAIDQGERIININRAACDMFNINPQSARGRTLQELVRNPHLNQCAAQTLQTREPVEGDLVVVANGERQVHLTATVLAGQENQPAGALLVLNDMTQVRRLERIRSDFIANVTHEIRTPVTSIKGYTETLLAGAADEGENCTHFLEIIGRQADRLCALVDDILSLSSLEESQKSADVAFETVRVAALVDAAVLVCRPRALQKEVALSVTCPEDIEIMGNAGLLEQAVVNLLDNATKYSEPGRKVEVSCDREGAMIAIRVSDCGCGIAPEHLPRIFERFYRVDRARSRKLGGTGLGLAIVKHIMALHSGTVTVESTLGKGSCFTLHIPAYSVLPSFIG